MKTRIENKKFVLSIFVALLLIPGSCGMSYGNITPVSERTPEVRDAIVAAVPDANSSSEVTDAHLAAINTLNLRAAGILELKTGDFSGMTALADLNLYDNMLSDLPERIFEGLTALTSLRLGRNAVDPMPLIVRLETVGADQFKVVISTGAPFDIVLPINVINNGVSSEETTVTIPQGSVESAPFTLLNTVNSTIEIGTLPGLPINHYGYTFAKSTACHRTPQVREAIVAAVSGVDHCRDVTDAHLAAIHTLDLKNKQISALKSGDFSGLSSLRGLSLSNNRLTTLPENLFSGLANLRHLYLNQNRLESLPAGVFSGLSSLIQINMHTNQLTTFPKTLFSGLPSLIQLYVHNNRLTTLDADVFSELSSLRHLYLSSNRFTTLPENLFSGMSSLEQLLLNNNQFDSLPQGVFRGLSTPTFLWTYENTVDPLSLTVSLEKVDAGEFKVVVPAGAPIDIVLSFSVTNGSITSGANSITIPAGRVESEPLTVTRTDGTVDDVTVDIDILSEIPTGHLGYRLVKSTDSPLEVIEGLNAAPVFTDGDTTTRAVSENTPTDVNIGAAIAATDADNDTLTYSLGGTDAASFDIDSTTGQLKTKAPLDYETKDTYTVTVTVSDDELTDTIDVTINVSDIDENIANRPPIFTDGNTTTRTVAENTAAGVNIGVAIAATDPDGNTLTYTLSGTDAASFDIADATGQLKTEAVLDYETKDSYTVTVTVSDSSLTDTIEVTINVTDVNDAPVFTEGDDTTRSVAENSEIGVSIGTPVAATDADGNPLRYTLGGTAAASFDVDSDTGQLKTTTVLDYESQSSYTVTLTVSDGSLTDIITVTINVSNENDAPVFIEGDSTTRRVAEHTLSGVEIGTAIAARDADNDTLIYTLGGTDAAVFEVDSTTGQLKTEKTLDFETQSSYKITLTVSDDSLSDTIDVTIIVTDIDETVPNRPPTFTDGDSTTRSVAEHTAAGVNIGSAVAATDPDGNTLIYTLGGTDAASFDIEPATGQLKTEAALDYETKNAYAVVVTVSDGSLTDTINVTIDVTNIDETVPNRAPIFIEGTNTTRTVAENTEVGVNIGAAVAATDADNDTLTYSLGGADAASFDIEPATGQLKTSAALDYGTQNAYTVVVTVSDGDLKDTISVTINISNTNEAPVFTEDDSTTRTVAENTETGASIGAAVAATDPDGNTLTYTLGGADTASFGIDGATGQLKTSAALDYETKNAYTVTVTVSDGSLTDTISVRINVTDVNEAPVFTEGGSTTRSVAENAETGVNIGAAVSATDVDDDTLTYSLSGTNAASFDIDSDTGQLKTSAALDYETKNAYTVTVTVSDDSLTDTIRVTINVTDVNEAPVFTAGNSTTRSVAENTAANVNIGAAVSATDVDDDTLMYALSGTDAASFGIDDATGQLKTSAPLDYETKNAYAVTVTASDGNLNDTIDVTISVTDVDETPPNSAPVFTAGDSTTRSVAENTAADVNIGAAVSATDADNDTLTYTLGGTDAASFGIDDATGQLKTSAPLDYETKDTYTVTVTVSDENDGSDSITVTITVTDVDENIPTPTFFSVCDRTPQVRDAIVAAAGVSNCDEVTEDHLAGIGQLDIDSKSITSLKTGDFDGLSTLRTLSLSNNQLTSLPEGIFDDLSALVNLRLHKNQLTSLPADLFDDTSSLESLWLQENQLTSVSEDIFNGLTSLSFVSLYFNKLTSVPEGLLDGLSSLSYVDLGGNQFTSVPADLFDGRSSLTSIVLSQGQLTSLPEDLFDGLTSLTSIQLSSNQLPSLPEDLFDGLTSLTRISLGTNKFTTLPVDIFDGLSSLERLSLQGNQFTTLPVDIFDGLSSLELLYLQHNLFTSLSVDLFDGLSSLKYLDLNSNKFSTLPADVFDGLSSLMRLELQWNTQLTTLPADVFDGLSSLEELVLHNSKLTSLPAGIFKGVSALTELNIHNNPVDPLPFTVSVEKVGENQFKATMPTGAPFTVVLPLSVANGSISGNVTSVTISTGSVESSPLTVTRASGTTGAVTVDIGTVPSIPSAHSGYTLVKSEDLPLEVISAVNAAPVLAADSDGSGNGSALPAETALLSNYPNPFNPETWIPYQLAKPAAVTLTVYNVRGIVVRRLVLGHRAAGFYYSRSRAAHWDGKNDLGENVAGGLYFYTFTAGDYTATRKMLIRK